MGPSTFTKVGVNIISLSKPMKQSQEGYISKRARQYLTSFALPLFEEVKVLKCYSEGSVLTIASPAKGLTPVFTK